MACPQWMFVALRFTRFQYMLGISTARQFPFQRDLPVGSSFRSIPYVTQPQEQFPDLRFNKHRTILYLGYPRKTVAQPQIPAREGSERAQARPHRKSTRVVAAPSPPPAPGKPLDETRPNDAISGQEPKCHTGGNGAPCVPRARSPVPLPDTGRAS